ncbi:RES family NAD+ phosphorylase [Flavisolibacter sp. BT320]|nr:RES family NAD+ phosphorylase [Flavisolibacter longurius]
MQVYRITLARYAGSLHASGNTARWNAKDVKMIYTASSRALACLENVVHRSGIGLKEAFRTMIIQVPDGLPITRIDKSSLLPDWHAFINYPYTQSLGNAWIDESDTAVLRVPSAIIPEEFNYLLNPLHPDFMQIQVVSTEPFAFDPRIKE